MHLAEIRVYPLKSARGLRPDAWPVDATGFAHDRRWMLVDEDGDFVSQRDLPAMARLQARLDGDALVVEGPGAAPLRLDAPTADTRPVTVWRDTVPARPAGSEADAWFSAVLGEPLTCVHMHADCVRAVDATWAPSTPDARVSFADGFPFLLCTDAALDALNARLEHPVTMDRFRPNLVVSGAPAHAEDGWRRVRIGDVELDVVKPCGRCTMTTVDPDRGAKVGKEPLRTLSTYRLDPELREVTFGQNLVHRGPGVLRVGDPVEVLEAR